MTNHRRILTALALVLVGCGRSDGPSADRQRPGQTRPPPFVSVLAGRDAQVAAYLMPLAADANTAVWSGDRLRALNPGGPELCFYRLAVFHLGDPDSADLVLDRLELSVLTAGGQRSSAPLSDPAAHPRVRASILPFRALEGYLGRSLTPGDSFVAITAFQEVLELESVEAGTLWAGSQEILLRPGRLTGDQLTGLLEFPRREDVLVGLATESEQGKAASAGVEGD